MEMFVISVSCILFKLRLFCGQTFLVMLQRHNLLCAKNNFLNGIFSTPVFLSRAERDDLGLDKGIPSLA